MDLLSPLEPPPLPDAREAADGALRRPLGQPALDRFLEPGDRVAVVAPLARGREDLGFAVEAVIGAAERAGVAAIGVYGAAEEGAPHRTLPTGGRALRPIAEADKVVVVSRIAFHPLALFSGGGWDLAEVAADGATRRALLEAEGLPAFLSALPPIFLLEAAFQRGGRPSAVFAGALDAAHREARAHWRRWRSLEVGPGYDGLVTRVERAEDAARAILLAARGLREGGTLVVVGPAPYASCPPLQRALDALMARIRLRFAEDLASAHPLLPAGRIAHLPDPLRTLLVQDGDHFPHPKKRVPSAA